MFENLIVNILKNFSRDFSLFRELGINTNETIEIIDILDSDIVIKTKELKLLRFIECKWTNNVSIIKEGIEQLLKVGVKSNVDYNVARFLVTNMEISEELRSEAKGSGVDIIKLQLS